MKSLQNATFLVIFGSTHNEIKNLRRCVNSLFLHYFDNKENNKKYQTEKLIFAIIYDRNKFMPFKGIHSDV